MTNQILLALAEQGKEHGYSILAASRDVYMVRKFHRVPSQRKEHGYSILASAILDVTALL